MGEKNFFEKCHFLVPIIGFTQFLNDLGHFSKFLKFGPFLAIFQIFHFFEFFRFFGLKNFSRKMFFVPKIWPNFWTIWGIFGNFSKIFPSFLVWKMGEKNHFLVPIIGFTQFLNDLGAFFKIFKIWAIFGNFSNFSFFLKFFRFLVWKKGEKKFSRKMSFFSAHNWFYPISERFGAFFKIFKIWAIFGNFSNFSFFWNFSDFLVWKTGEKKFLEKCHFLVPKIGFTQFLNDLGHFWQNFSNFSFFKFFSFLVWKMGEKKFLEKSFLVPKIGFKFLNDLGGNFSKFFWSFSFLVEKGEKNVIF